MTTSFVWVAFCMLVMMRMLQVSTLQEGMSHPSLCFYSNKTQVLCSLIRYKGGPVIPNVNVQLLFWESYDPSLKEQLSTFFVDITDSPYLDWLTEYSPNSSAVLGRGMLGGIYTIQSPDKSKSLSSSLVLDTLDSLICNGTLPSPDVRGNTLYFIAFPSGYIVDRAGSSCQNNIAAWHDSFYSDSLGTYVAYAIHPWTYGCLNLASFLDGLTAFQWLTAIASHELVESITDPLGSGWVNDILQTHEIADACEWTTMPFGVVSTENCNQYTVSYALSQLTQETCVLSVEQASDFAVAVSPRILTIDAGGSAIVAIDTFTTTGAPQNLSFSILGIPDSVQAQLSSFFLISGDYTTMNLSVTASAASVVDAMVSVVAANEERWYHSAGFLLTINGVTPTVEPCKNNSSSSQSGLLLDLWTLLFYLVKKFF